MCGGVVPELGDPGMLLERGLDDAALYTCAASVNQPDGRYPGGRGRIDVLGHNRANVAGRERVEVELVSDGYSHRVWHATTLCTVSL